MTEIRRLTQLSTEDIEQVIGPYTVDAVYRVRYTDLPEATSIELVLEPLPAPITRHYSHFDAETLQRYQQMLSLGFSYGAYQNEQLVGLIIAEPAQWNHSLWVWEFHVAGACRGQGIGRQLMETVAAQARAAGCRVMVCETQNTNATAIQVYRQLGFRVEGVDISYYTNLDYPDQDMAVFMKRRLD